MGKVDSPHVVRATHASEFLGLHYLVMDWINRTDLLKFIEERGSQSVPQSCELVRQAALGLAAAHKLGLVHRDMKRSNVFLTNAYGLPAEFRDSGRIRLLYRTTVSLLLDTSNNAKAHIESAKIGLFGMPEGRSTFRRTDIPCPPRMTRTSPFEGPTGSIATSPP
ncbi:MAG: protein kinase [Planctomycetaceae bacterium]|nr:protein kinase [Planctomycetaceae bacterium]